MNYEEFLTAKKEAEPQDVVQEAPVEEPVAEPQELDVQKAVVEELAAAKVEMNEKIGLILKEKEEAQAKNEELLKEIETLKEQVNCLQKQVEEQKAALEKVGDTLAQNSETPESNKVALLDRAFELPDRFEGETRDHVLEVLKEARDKAEQEGRLRCAQLLEGVLLANEPTGNLADRRKSLEKLFVENQNIVSGPVIAELTKLGISHKNGEDYLLPSEIMKRTY